VQAAKQTAKQHYGEFLAAGMAKRASHSNRCNTFVATLYASSRTMQCSCKPDVKVAGKPRLNWVRGRHPGPQLQQQPWLDPRDG
jgi:hypothetical protein